METTPKVLIVIVCLIILGFTLNSIFPGFIKFSTTPQKQYVIDIRSNTEYYDGDSGKILTLISDLSGKAISANCTASILYPNGSSFIISAPTPTQSELGSYYLDFTAPSVEGVYEYLANCSIGGRNQIAGKSFHISNSTNIILNAIHDQNASLTIFLSGINQTLTSNSLSTQTLINDSFNNLSAETISNFNTVISLLQNVSVNFSLADLTSQLSNLTLLIQTYQTETQTNFSQVISLLLAANESINSNIDMTKQLIIQANQSLSLKLDQIILLEQNESNSHAEIMSFLSAMNSSLTQQINNINLTFGNETINVFVTANDCYLNGLWLIQAQVTNQFGVQYSSPPMFCNVTTDLWGGPVAMSYNGGLKLFQYTHVCDVGGTIGWSVDCTK